MGNQIKTLLLSLLVCSTLIISSCGNNDPSPGGSAFEFLNQNLQGTIDGQPFSLGDGQAELSPIDNSLSFTLYHRDELIEDVCNVLSNELAYVTLSTPNQVGVYGLGSLQAVSLVNPNGETINGISTGAVEITTITSTQVTGRLDIRFDADNTVNGNFNVRICTGN